MRVLTRGFSSGQSVTKGAPRRALPDPRFDIKFFIMKAKVLQTYREALQLARDFRDPDMRAHMTEMVRHEFRPLRRDRGDSKWKLDSERIDYQLAIIRKQINMIKDLKERVA